MSRSGNLQNAAAGIVVICALVITGLIVRRELAPASLGAARNSSVFLIDPETAQQITIAGHLIGPEEARVRIVEFVDLQCPFCAIADRKLRSVLGAFDGQVAVVVRHFPLQTIHPHAYRAALAAECAAADGMFERFVQVVYRAQDSLGIHEWETLAERAGISNLDSFAECVDTERFSERVRRDMEVATNIGVKGTPTFLVGRSVYMGDPSTAEFRSLIQEALGRYAIDRW